MKNENAESFKMNLDKLKELKNQLLTIANNLESYLVHAESLGFPSQIEGKYDTDATTAELMADQFVNAKAQEVKMALTTLLGSH